MNFTKTSLNALRSDLDAALNAVAKKHGISLGIKGITFDSNSFRTTLVGASSSIAADNSEAEFKKYSALFGIKSNSFGTIFEASGDTYRIVGIKPQSYKFPILAKQLSNGKVYKLPMNMIPANLKAA